MVYKLVTFIKCITVVFSNYTKIWLLYMWLSSIWDYSSSCILISTELDHLLLNIYALYNAFIFQTVYYIYMFHCNYYMYKCYNHIIFEANKDYYYYYQNQLVIVMKTTMQWFVHDFLTTTRNSERFLQYFLVILKLLLDNYKRTRRKCFFEPTGFL